MSQHRLARPIFIQNGVAVAMWSCSENTPLRCPVKPGEGDLVAERFQALDQVARQKAERCQEQLPRPILDSDLPAAVRTIVPADARERQWSAHLRPAGRSGRVHQPGRPTAAPGTHPAIASGGGSRKSAETPSRSKPARESIRRAGTTGQNASTSPRRGRIRRGTELQRSRRLQQFHRGAQRGRKGDVKGAQRGRKRSSKGKELKGDVNDYSRSMPQPDSLYP